MKAIKRPTKRVLAGLTTILNWTEKEWDLGGPAEVDDPEIHEVIEAARWVRDEWLRLELQEAGPKAGQETVHYHKFRWGGPNTLCGGGGDNLSDQIGEVTCVRCKTQIRVIELDEGT